MPKKTRRQSALEVRINAAQLAHDRPHPTHIANGDEIKFSKKKYLASFTKGLPHDYETGLILDEKDFRDLVHSINTGEPDDFIKVRLGPDGNAENPAWKHSPNCVCEVEVRAWESAGAGHTFDLEGPDAQAVTMPPHPKLGSHELTAEMAEVYSQATLRDVPFCLMMDPSDGSTPKEYGEFIKRVEEKLEGKLEGKLQGEQKRLEGRIKNLKNKLEEQLEKELEEKLKNKLKLLENKLKQLQGKIGAISIPWFPGASALPNDDLLKGEIEKLNKLVWFSGSGLPSPSCGDSNRRRGAGKAEPVVFTPPTVFRGQTTGDKVGPYISQFLLAGDTGLDQQEDPSNGMIHYGSIRIDQRVRVAKPNVDYMEAWDEWFDVQNGAELNQDNLYVAGPPKYRFITTPRDLATYVHNDALYESYLNASLLLLNNGYKFDPGIPFQNPDWMDHQQGFAQFGGPHILTLVTEVATRALKAVRYQKFNIHRRMRPEVLAARLFKSECKDTCACLEQCLSLDECESLEQCESLDKCKKVIINACPELTTTCKDLIEAGYAAETGKLLPMAFPEGSPMHPSYGAGHATVAGACVTILKAFFDHSAELDLTQWGKNVAFVPACNGSRLEAVALCKPLTVEGELNKLASNISIGRDWAGVHYYSDYIESLRMGEKIALGILEEQKLTYGETFSMTVPLFDGGSLTI